MLSHQLTDLMQHLNKVFYAGDGSCAVEIALKMSLHSRVIQGQSQKNRFLALKNSFHGETIGGLSVSDLGVYRTPYSCY
jgi:adenosylmethionine-8-amino-7-oxononanoate aminotransferase